ncbi:MAG: hypothetical protein RQ966_19920 [Acetobacteraceae bacterium]|nr:hypothetical protein [Acetobacteraceae bacterium]
MDLWFPHLPLSVAIAVLGAFQAAPGVRRTLALNLAGADLLRLPQELLLELVRAGPRVILGLFLAVMALGLLLRSRLAWVIAVLLISVSLVLTLREMIAGQNAPVALAAGTALLLACILLAYRHFDRSSIATATLLAITSVASLLAYATAGAYCLSSAPELCLVSKERSRSASACSTGCPERQACLRSRLISQTPRRITNRQHAARTP